MKGLLLKELYSAGIYLKNLVLMLVIIVVISVFTPMGTTYVSMMMMMYLMILSIGQYSVDEKSTWAPFSLCLPVRRATIVGARYLFLFVILAVAMAFTLGLSAIVAAVRGTTGWLLESLAITGMGATLFLVVNAIIAPITYKIGSEKARYFVMLVAMLPFLALVLFSNQITALVQAAATLNVTALILAAAAVAAAMYIGSLFLSTRIYARKEY